MDVIAPAVMGAALEIAVENDRSVDPLAASIIENDGCMDDGVSGGEEDDIQRGEDDCALRGQPS